MKIYTENDPYGTPPSHTPEKGEDVNLTFFRDQIMMYKQSENEAPTNECHSFWMLMLDKKEIVPFLHPDSYRLIIFKMDTEHQVEREKQNEIHSAQRKEYHRLAN